MSNVITNIPEQFFVLPEFKPSEKRKKEFNNVPDVESLTPEQRAIYDYLVLYAQGKLDEEGIRMISIKGYAGTGKTYLFTQFLKWYVMMMQAYISVTAPTNKAVKVLRQTANFEHSLISYSTIHKLFGLKEKIDELTGKQTFEREYGAECDVDEKDALGIDETSMLPDDLFHMVNEENDRNKEKPNNRISSVGDKNSIDGLLNKASNVRKTFTTNLKVIFLGDPIQIPPVGKADCIPFNENNTDEYGIKTLYLTEIIRQKVGNPILDLATIVRENYKSAHLPYERTSVYNEIGSTMFINSNDKDVLYRLCETYFASEHFANDSDFMKVIAWTNKTVDFMNDKIRTYIYKEEFQKQVDEMLLMHPDMDVKKIKLPKVMVGEKLIANSPIINDIGFKQVIIFNTNDEFEVVSSKIVTRNVFDNYEVRVYETKVVYMDYGKGKKETKFIDVLHEQSANTFNTILETLKNKAIKADKSVRGQAWKFYYSMKNKFADVKYNYAITAHKSQGSTYDNAIVIAVDILKNSKIEERNRIMYVAVTRAKNNLFIVE